MLTNIFTLYYKDLFLSRSRTQNPKKPGIMKTWHISCNGAVPSFASSLKKFRTDIPVSSTYQTTGSGTDFPSPVDEEAFVLKSAPNFILK